MTLKSEASSLSCGCPPPVLSSTRSGLDGPDRVVTSPSRSPPLAEVADMLAELRSVSLEDMECKHIKRSNHKRCQVLGYKCGDEVGILIYSQDHSTTDSPSNRTCDLGTRHCECPVCWELQSRKFICQVITSASRDRGPGKQHHESQK